MNNASASFDNTQDKSLSAGKRSVGVTLTAIILLCLSVYGIFKLIKFTLSGFLFSSDIFINIFWILSLLFSFFSITSIGLLMLKNWSRIASIVLSSIITLLFSIILVDLTRLRFMSLSDKILNVHSVLVGIIIIFFLLLILYLTRPKVRDQFINGSR